ncbi:MAG TPA: aromatic ring-hydroxylating dioxygenase subunit alpha [Terriglobales bacterium]|nr:aromatic ring-hydroxylating dioxygenase subunit alpha [Terriglobales bacterium]
MSPNTKIPTTLPARYYTDAAVFSDELERFFCQTWICAGRAQQIEAPGDYFVREIGDESIVITRDETGQPRAFYNVCRHRGTRFCAAPEGKFPGRIQCPYHGWTYGLNGCLLGAPHMDRSFRHADYPLNPVHCDVWDGHTFINLNPRPAPLTDQLSGLPEKFARWCMQDLRLYKRIAYAVKANWKLIVLNYNECLHCPILHPQLNQLTDYLSGANAPPSPNFIGGSMELKHGIDTMSTDGKRRRDYLPGLTEAERQLVLYYAIYPNLLLSLHPDYMMTHTLWPRAVDSTEVICEWHFHPAEMAKPDFHADDAVNFWDLTNRQDWSISELSQAGIKSRAYQPGPYSTQENLPHAFDEMILHREQEAQSQSPEKRSRKP